MFARQLQGIARENSLFHVVRTRGAFARRLFLPEQDLTGLLDLYEFVNHSPFNFLQKSIRSSSSSATISLCPASFC